MDHRLYQQLRAEEILVPVLIAFPLHGIVVVRRNQGRTQLLVALSIHGIDIRQQPVAQAQDLSGHLIVGLRIPPRLLAAERIAVAVQPVDRGEHAPLQPADVKLIVLHAAQMPADIMAPPGIAHICRRSSKIGLIFQGRPGHMGISGKTDGVPMAAQSAVAGQHHAPFPIPF